MADSPDAVFLNTEKSASKSSFALLTGTEMLSQSPAGEMVVGVRPASCSHDLTASAVSGLGATRAST